MWQALHAELEPQGLTMVTVALDTNAEAARPFHDAAAATHPSLVDSALSFVELFGITNVPFGIWVDESGTIVRPAEVSYAPRDTPSPEQKAAQEAAQAKMPEQMRTVIQGMQANMGDTSRYTRALRDWVAKGADSEWVLSPDQVIAKSRPRPPEAAQAAAEFELGQHLHRTGHPRDAVTHFQEAHRLDPTNWSYPRQAMSLADPEWGQVYERDLLSEVAHIGVDTFYPTLDM